MNVAQLMWEYSSCHPDMCHGSPWKTLPRGQGRCRRQWLGRDKEAPKERMVLVKRLSKAPSWWLQTPSAAVPTLQQDVQTQDSRPRRCRRHHQLLFCAILAPGGCGLVFPRERGSLFVSASPGESFPSGGMGLNSALGYIPSITRCGWCSAVCLWHPEPEHGASLLCQNHSWPNPSG